ncbi:MAG TPA: outer membrane beta-barrel protein, partial [Cyclobacteriaceae bacterium]|nr:outer membrane beta-barrel protein [Cyclobacteriaceae bacterium]
MYTASKRLIVAKWLIIAMLLVSLTTSRVFAQNFSLGAKAGPLVLWSPFGDKEDGKGYDVQPKFGYYVAGIINFPLKNNYTCVIEGGFSQKGRKVEFEGNFNNGTYYFVDAALLLRKSFNFNLGKNIPATGFFNIGPHISYWLGGKGTVGGVGGDGSPYKIEFIDSLTADDNDFKTMYMVDVNRWLFGADIG